MNDFSVCSLQVPDAGSRTVTGEVGEVTWRPVERPLDAVGEVRVATVEHLGEQLRDVVDGEVIPVMVDEVALTTIAEETGGRFFTAASADELQQVYDEVGVEQEDREIGEWFAGLGLLLGALAAVGSLTWFRRLP